MQVEPMTVEGLEEDWAAWNARCSVAHRDGGYVAARNTRIAFHRLQKPLSELRVALATSSGVYVKDQPPFDMVARAGDRSVRWIPADVDSRDLRFAHDHYDHTDADRDPNCVFPIDRLRELAAAGAIGSVAAAHVGFMGFIPQPDLFVSETVPEVASRLVRDGVDVAVLSPG